MTDDGRLAAAGTTRPRGLIKNPSTEGRTTTNFTLNNDDELTATSGGFVNSYGYNANGEQISRTLSGTAYTQAFDYEGQLTSITQGSNVVSFAYDAEGRRFSRTSGGTTTRFLRGPGGILLEKQGSTVSATYTHGNAQIRKDSEYPLYDGIGSERTVTAANQSVSGTITFEGFGQTVATTGSSGNPYMFKGAWGYRNDGDAGLHHVGARYYDAQVGRFITRDTMLSEHPYLYCEHDSVNRADPSGHQSLGGVAPWQFWQPGQPPYVDFTPEDWIIVADEIDNNGNELIVAGGLTTAGSVFGSPRLGDSVPFLTPPTITYPQPWGGSVTVRPVMAKPAGIGKVVGPALFIAGWIVKGVAKGIRSLFD